MIARSLRMKDTSKSSPIRLVSYLTDTQQHEHRVAEVRITNCDSIEPQWAAMEMTVTQRMNTRAQGDKTYHLLISFQADEHPSPEIIHAIEDEFCARLGFDGHQRVSVLHTDSDNLHLHICVNKIHPERLTIHTPYYDHNTLADTCVRLEKHFALAEDNHIPRAEAVETAAKSMEHGGDVESLIGWMQRHCLEDLKGANSWEDLHETLRKQGLTINERGNGFIFESNAENGEVRVKASSVDRSLSRKRLEDRLGPFELSRDRGRPESVPGYEKKPMPRKNFDSSALWKRFQEWREEQDRVRTRVLKSAQRQRDNELAVVGRLADTRTQVIRHMVTGAAMKRVLHAMNRARLQRKRAEIRAAYRQETALVRRPAQFQQQGPQGQQQTHMNWRSWLQEEARKGDAQALAALRARDPRQRSPHRVSGKGTGSTASAAVKVTSKGTIIFEDGRRDSGLPQQYKARPITPSVPPQYTIRKDAEHRNSRGR